MKISVLDVQRTLFEGVVSQAVLPGTDGELSLMDDHEPIFVALTRGYIRLKPLVKTGKIQPILIHRGLARMRHNELVVLVE